MIKNKKTLFNEIDDITWKKTLITEYYEEDEKSISVYMINRYLSMRMEFTDLVNSLQKYTIGLLSPRETYKLYHDVLPASKGFAKYVKGSKEDKYNAKLITQIAEHYTVSKNEAIEYLDLLDQTKCTTILALYGYTEAEIKTLIKGIKK